MSLVYMEITSFVHSSECSRTGVHGTISTASQFVSSNNMFSGTVEIHLVSRFIIVDIRANLVCLMDCITKSSFSVGLSLMLVYLQTRSPFIGCCTNLKTNMRDINETPLNKDKSQKQSWPNPRHANPPIVNSPDNLRTKLQTPARHTHFVNGSLQPETAMTVRN
ncbi:unnamed protein product [Brassica oleracea]